MIEIFGTISPPPGVANYIVGETGEAPGFVRFLSNIVKLIIVVGGLYAFFNIIMAGYGFLSAGDDPKKMAASWVKIWQSLLGLLLVAGSFVLAAIFGYIIFQDTTALLQPKIYTP